LDTRIFDLDMSVEATSAYIVIDKVAHSGIAVTLDAIRPYWNSGEKALHESMDELQKRGVVARLGEGDTARFLLKPAGDWK
jgi:hypothetical protein